MKSNKLGLLTTKIGSGITPRGGQSVYQNSGTHLIRSQNIYNHKFEKNGLVCISQEIAEKMKSVEIMTDDVLINITGDSVARVYLVPDEILPARVNQHVCILRTKPELNPHYLYYFLINPTTQNHLLSIAGIGGTRNALTKEMLYNLIIEYPDLPTQEKIVKQLNTIKNKIITLENQNRILEQTAQAIFKSWFVDFDGVTEFEDSELGKIPKGWEIKKFDEICNFSNGYAFSSKDLTNLPKSDYCVFKMGHIKIGGGFNISYKTEFYKGSIHQKLENYLLKFGDVLMCMTDMKNNVRLLGHTALFFEQKYSYFVNQRVGLIREKSQDSSIKFSFIYCLTNSQNFLNDLRSRANSGVQVNLSSEHIKETKIISPDNSTAKKFDKLSRPLFKRIMINEGKIQSLTKTRDTLLPKLMSGEIRV